MANTVDRRKKNVNWLVTEADGSIPTWERVQLAVLMDIRDELQTLNRVFACPNFLEIPAMLRKIRGNTSRIPIGKGGAR